MEGSSLEQEAPEAVDPSTEPLFSLISGEGDGFMLGLAAGDTAGGAWELGYSAVTEQATIITYELISQPRLDEVRLVELLRELDGSLGEDPVYRAESPHFRAWLNRAAAGAAVPEEDPSIDGAPRAAALGVRYRRDAASLIEEAVRLGRLFHHDASSVMAGVMTAAAVAASCFAQSGRDLISGVMEVVAAASGVIGRTDLTGVERIADLQRRLESAHGAVGVTRGEEALEHSGGDRGDPTGLVIAGILLAAPVGDRFHRPVEEAARLGGSPLGAAVGAMVGARIGIRAWPWAFANDTWFAELGRRLVRGPSEVNDLPIPYAVEQHLMTGARPGYL